MQKNSIHNEDLSIYQDGWHRNELASVLFANLDLAKQNLLPWIKIHSAIVKEKKHFIIDKYAKHEAEMGIVVAGS